MEERTGKKPREAVGWKWQRQRKRQKDNRQGKRGEEREKGGVTSQTSNIWMISLWNVSTHFGFSFVFRKKRKRRRNPTGWGETSSSVMASCLTHTHTHSARPLSLYLIFFTIMFQFPNKQIFSSLMNPAFIVFLSSILHLPPPHRVLIPPAAPPQILKTK